MKKARLIVTYECEKNCAGCCNKDWKGKPPTPLRNIKQLVGYDEVLITGGEPLLFPQHILELVYKLRHEVLSNAKIYIYTAAVERPATIARSINIIDGVCLTIHTQKDANVFGKYFYWGGACGLLGKSMRLNIFKGVEIAPYYLNGWQVKRDLEWTKDCPLPADEELFVLENPWTRKGE